MRFVVESASDSDQTTVSNKFFASNSDCDRGKIKFMLKGYLQSQLQRMNLLRKTDGQNCT